MLSRIADSLDGEGFAALAAACAARPDADLFLSCAGADTPVCRIGVAPTGECVVQEHTPRTEIAAFLFDTPGTALGCLPYEYGLARMGIATDKVSSCPPGRFRKYRVMLVYDMAAQTLDAEGDAAFARQMLDAARQAPATSGQTYANQTCAAPNTPLRESLDREGYMRGVEEVLEAIRSGMSYQLCLSSEYAAHVPGLDPAALFMRLWREAPAPYYALYRLGAVTVISSSPERFLSVREGRVLSQPIKGTLAFDTYTPDLDARVTESPKESAELSMIVDLIRNDISAHCEYGSVRVRGHKSTFVVENLIQMYTNVTGRLRQNSTCLDLLLDAFPGGSVTGCPKHSSMRIIEALEPHARGMYCGSLVVVQDERSMESNIAIRTATYDARDAVFRFHAGSGIVIDSKPEAEHKETLAKASKFFRILGL
ncbi:chorismate-binding protein [Desulfobaculum sp. SPO524]|uniref:chorismate-binding protein n=1 Tax=Desulfobaculum sp. SPO524 TaxID=3378071 RepID=UPI003852E428